MGFKVTQKEYNGGITFLINEDGATIELNDVASGTTFVKISLDVQQLAEMLSRRWGTPCNIETYNLDVVGKKLTTDRLEFELPKCNYKNQKKVAYKKALEICPEGWEPDNYFNSQNSFFRKDGKEFAQTTIRKWE
jgi:hypothetical protein